MSWAVLAVRFWESFEQDCYTHHTRSIRDNQIQHERPTEGGQISCLSYFLVIPASCTW